jgi:uncharacterized protein YnzC (UPF0291/DUF896 family)
MDKCKTDRINELSLKSKKIGLTDAEKEEQKILRQEYIQAFRGNLKLSLDNLVIMDNEGNKTPLKKKGNN